MTIDEMRDVIALVSFRDYQFEVLEPTDLTDLKFRGRAAMMQRKSISQHPRRAEFRRRLRGPIFGLKQRRGPVGCYECCQGRGSRHDLWEKLCLICQVLTRADIHCEYLTVKVNPRIEVPRKGSNRWKLFLRKYPRFSPDKAQKPPTIGEEEQP